MYTPIFLLLDSHRRRELFDAMSRYTIDASVENSRAVFDDSLQKKAEKEYREKEVIAVKWFDDWHRIDDPLIVSHRPDLRHVSDTEKLAELQWETDIRPISKVDGMETLAKYIKVFYPDATEHEGRIGRWVDPIGRHYGWNLTPFELVSKSTGNDEDGWLPYDDVDWSKFKLKISTVYDAVNNTWYDDLSDIMHFLDTLNPKFIALVTIEVSRDVEGSPSI